MKLWTNEYEATLWLQVLSGDFLNIEQILKLTIDLFYPFLANWFLFLAYCFLKVFLQGTLKCLSSIATTPLCVLTQSSCPLAALTLRVLCLAISECYQESSSSFLAHPLQGFVWSLRTGNFIYNHLIKIIFIVVMQQF